jgi:hypothetical protein
LLSALVRTIMEGMTETMDIPRLTRTPRGWLAVSPPRDHPLVGVEGKTEPDAVQRYQEARAKWRALLDAPEPIRD